MRIKIKCMLLIVMLGMISSQGFAENLILNGSFENPVTPDRETLSGVNNSWDYSPDTYQSGVTLQYEPGQCPSLAAADGTQFGYLYCGPADEFAQNVSGLSIGETYFLEWSEAGKNGAGAINLKVVLDASTEICASHTVPDDATWRQTNVSFTATATSHNIRFINCGGWAAMVFVDEVTLRLIPNTITIANGDFEAPAVTDYTDTNGVVETWEYLPNTFRCGLINQNNVTFCPALADASSGSQFAFLYCGGGAGGGDEIRHEIGGFTPGVSYSVGWFEAGRSATADGALEVNLDGTTVISASHAIPNNETWNQVNVNFTATKPFHSLRFVHDGAWDTMIFIDDVVVIPEPATLGLLALVGLAFLRKK